MGAASGLAQERLPPAPRDHFNDYARAVSPATAQALNERLVQFERESSNQLVVAIYPRMESASSAEDYTVRVAQAWGVGTEQRRNGAVLFAFMQERQLYLQVGYGLEGVLPDARSKQIIEEEIIPRMRSGDPDAAFTAGVEAMIAAARGEYVGTGRTVAQGRGASGDGGGGVGFFIFLIVLMLVLRNLRRGSVYHPRGRRSVWMGPGPWGGRGGGGGGFGRGGSFSGGGGGFGGGGAGGRW